MSLQLDGLGAFAVVVAVVVAGKLAYDVIRVAGIVAAVALFKGRSRADDSQGLSVAERIRNARKVAR